WGFCDSPLLVESDKYEYICAPAQDRHRFGQHIHYNSHSQRSEEPDTQRTIVLGLGDSVINGGVMTDQQDLATEQASDERTQILNISAGSWGPDNCAAYLRERGLFGARLMLLVVSSHDAHDNMDFQPVVGVSASFPDRQYRSAIVELWQRYLLPRITRKKDTADPDRQVAEGVGIHKAGKTFNTGFDELKGMADEAGIDMVIYLHPDQKEMSERRFNEQEEEIIAWAKANGVELTSGLDAGESLGTYRDGIHLNAEGQKILGEWMRKTISEHLGEC
ncbi:MAG: hypothetical protein LUC33_07245, partial [Prevotellaceae bacterium]|nr:hypothetical protein [Prevotellaceae bacterium]